MASTDSPRPNILFVHVDELRYPVHFPAGVDSADAFVERFMPNTFRRLWKPGVKFSRYYTAASDCSAARGTFVTGLYAQQTNLMIVRSTKPGPLSPPALDPDFPTYGKLLRESGYDTPYVGKWHLSDAPPSDSDSAADYLDDYGFEGLTIPDPNGIVGQGIGAAPRMVSDACIAQEGIAWLQNRAASGSEKPFCLTVGFINPHDKQWFWSGPEAVRFNQVFSDDRVTMFAGKLQTYVDEHKRPPVDVPREGNPPQYGYTLPANWQSKTALAEPGVPRIAPVFAALTDFACGGIDDTPGGGFAARKSLLCELWHAAFAPYDYWIRALDMYTQAIGDVDRQIGVLLDGIPESLLQNTVVVFTSDHGEYASSHGLQGKGVTAYEETMRVPLVVYDPAQQITRHPEVERTQIASHVDLLRLLLGIANDGDAWMNHGYRQMYGNRLDLLAVLRDPSAPGRAFAAYTCDEYFLPPALNYAQAPDHATALMFPNGKLTAFACWKPFTNTPVDTEYLYYDRGTAAGLLELESSPAPIDLTVAAKLLADEVRAPLPIEYQAAQRRALEAYLGYVVVVEVGAAAAVKMSQEPASTPAPSTPVYLPRVNAA